MTENFFYIFCNALIFIGVQGILPGLFGWVYLAALVLGTLAVDPLMAGIHLSWVAVFMVVAHVGAPGTSAGALLIAAGVGLDRLARWWTGQPGEPPVSVAAELALVFVGLFLQAMDLANRLFDHRSDLSIPIAKQGMQWRHHR